MNEKVNLEALAEALSPTADVPPQEELLEGDAPQGQEADALAVKGDETPNEDDASTEEEPKTVEGVDVLTLLNAEGEAEQVKLDKLLSDTMHDIEIEGETRQVSYDELRRGYMQQEDYTRKTQAVAQQVDELAPYADMVAFAKTDPNFVQYMQAYFIHGADPAAGLSKFSDVTDAQLAQLLSSEDPQELNRGREIAKERATTRQALQEREQRISRQMQEKQQLWSQWVANEQQRARTEIPDYDNALKGKETYLKDYGFTPQEIESLVDHRYQRVLADALEGQRLKETRTSPKSELRAKRKQPAPSRSIKSSGRGKLTDSVQTRSRQAEKRARETGRTDDWAVVIGTRLGLD